MTLSDEYQRQSAWRPWASIFDALPSLRDNAVLDLGCGVGSQAAELVARGARVVGIDNNRELLREARSRRLPAASFRRGDLRSTPDLETAFDGLWCSFAAAYFPDLPSVLIPWAGQVRPGGWVAITEVDDLFAHEPLPTRTSLVLRDYARAALAAGRYDFHMGRKLPMFLERSGLTLSTMLTLQDQELAFQGPAVQEVVAAWHARFERMDPLRDFCGADFGQVRDDFLACLVHEDHRSSAKVCCCIASESA